jgi:quinol monooxygenase YgiN
MKSRRVVFELLIAVFATVLLGCDSGRIEKLEKQNQEILTQLHQREAVQIYDLEAKCAQEAKAYFSEHWRPDKMTAVLNRTNHYNRSLNKCLILVREQSFMDENNEWYLGLTLADVHQGDEVGLFVESHAATTTSLTRCYVGDTSCTSQQDFESRIKSYMAN